MIDHEALKAAGLARGGKDGVRILGKGEFTAKLSFKVAGVSTGAREAIEKAGGSVELIEVVPAADKAAAKKGSAKAQGQGGRLSLPPLPVKADKPESGHYMRRRGRPASRRHFIS